MDQPRTSRPRRTRRTRLVAALAGLAAVSGLAGCGDDDVRPARAEDTASAEGTGTDGSGAAGTMPSGAPATTYPSFAPTDYTYTLGVQCYCPMLGEDGRVLVSVRDGRVADAVVDAGPTGDGVIAPEFARLTIQDVIDRANQVAAGVGAADETGTATVTWPDGQAWPSKVELDPVPGAVDDEVTYTITDVSLG